MMPMVLQRDAMCWWRGKGLVRFHAGQRVWVPMAIARSLMGMRSADHDYHHSKKGYLMSSIIAHAIERIAPPESEPVSLSDAKHYLRVEHAEDDAMIGLMITAAREAAEAYLGTSFITQRWKMTLEHVLPDMVPLRFGLVQAIVSIVLRDEQGDGETLGVEGYRLSIDKRSVIVLSPRSGFRFEITYDAGYGSAPALIPGLIRQGILQHVAAMYEHRDLSVVMPAMALQAYHPYKEINL